MVDDQRAETKQRGEADRLRESLAGEAGLLCDLRASLLQQRDALAQDDAGALESVVHQIGRTLLALREARQERGRLTEQLAGGPLPLGAMAERLDGEAGPEVIAAGRDVHLAAAAAHRELTINQAVIRRAIQSGEHYLQRLLTLPGVGDDSLGYTGAPPESATGLLLNQQA